MYWGECKELVINKRLLSEKEKFVVHMWYDVLFACAKTRFTDVSFFFNSFVAQLYTSFFFFISFWCDRNAETWVLLLYAQRWHLCVANFVDIRSQHNNQPTDRLTNQISNGFFSLLFLFIPVKNCLRLLLMICSALIECSSTTFFEVSRNDCMNQEWFEWKSKNENIPNRWQGKINYTFKMKVHTVLQEFCLYLYVYFQLYL